MGLGILERPKDAPNPPDAGAAAGVGGAPNVLDVNAPNEVVVLVVVFFFTGSSAGFDGAGAPLALCEADDVFAGGGAANGDGDDGGEANPKVDVFGIAARAGAALAGTGVGSVVGPAADREAKSSATVLPSQNVTGPFISQLARIK